MKLFIDTANIEEIKEIEALGILRGVTTNPSLIAKEGQVFEEVIEEISQLVDGPISAEVMASQAPDMVREARALSQIHKNIVIKVPMTEEGLKAIRLLKEEGIKTNCTLVFSAQQALLAALAGAAYVSPFMGRLDDIGQDGAAIIRDIADIYRLHQLDTEIIAASIRTPKHVLEAAQSGAHIATVPYGVIKKMVHHPLTDQGIEKFASDFKGTTRRFK
ncbi:MAG: fructose-6-phosphate aldolase [Tissierellia bacterium]|nr:fructose-6-phosphate aldolase [Tissierellia bacterium]